MRDIEQIERDLTGARRRLQELEQEKSIAEEELRSPRKEEIRKRYELIKATLYELDCFGENVTDVEGFALHIKGTSFEISPDGGVQEV